MDPCSHKRMHDGSAGMRGMCTIEQHETFMRAYATFTQPGKPPSDRQLYSEYQNQVWIQAKAKFLAGHVESESEAAASLMVVEKELLRHRDKHIKLLKVPICYLAECILAICMLHVQAKMSATSVPGHVCGEPSLKTQLYDDVRKLIESNVAADPPAAPTSSTPPKLPAVVSLANPTNPAEILSALQSAASDLHGDPRNTDRTAPASSSSAASTSAPQVQSGDSTRKDVCSECVIRAGLAQQGKCAVDFPVDGKPGAIAQELVAACRTANAELPTRTGDPDNHANCGHTKVKHKTGPSRQNCKRDVRLELQGTGHAAALAMYGKVRKNLNRYF